MTVLEEAISRACRPDSIYLAFLDADELDPNLSQMVEIRIDVSEAAIFGLGADAEQRGWQVRAIESAPQGSVFLRREQALSEPSLFELFRDALTLAYAHGGRFHSWLHGSDLEDNA